MVVKGASLLPKSKVDGGCSRLRGLVILRVSVNVGINLKFAIKIADLYDETKGLYYFTMTS